MSVVRACLAAFIFAACCAVPAFAQNIRANEATYAYAAVRGWNVVALDERAGNVGCRASITQSGRPLMIEVKGFSWTLIFRNQANGTFAGGVIEIDGYVEDSQFGFFNGYASKEISQSTLQRLKRGNRLRVRVNGFNPQNFVLKGSAAAIDKLIECAQNKGEKPVVTARPAPKPRVLERLTGTCAPYAGAPYSCQGVERPVKPGYVEVFEVNPTWPNNATPYYLFEVLNGGQEADAWVAWGQGEFQYYGRWIMFDRGTGGCLEPAPNQNAQVRALLGQDAWGLCIS